MIVLKTVKSEDIEGAFLDSVKKLGRISGICVLLTKPYEAVMRALRKKGVDASKILFIDTLSAPDEDNVINVEPGNLTAMSITIQQAMQALPAGRKFLVIDSLSMLTVHSKPQIVIKFVLFLFERMRKWGVETVVVTAKDNTDAELLSILKQGADKTEAK